MRGPAGSPTINTVAEHARVSRQTVSNALNAPERLRAETLHRVLSSIDVLGYRPNHAARSLRTQVTRLLGCRLQPMDVVGSDVILDRFLHGLCTQAREHGYDVLTFAAVSDEDELGVVEDLLRRTAVDAVVLSNTAFGDTRPQWLSTRGVPFAAFGRPWGQPGSDHSWVDVDGAAGVALAVDHLVGLGHRRIAFLGWPRGSGVGDDRFTGWERTVRALRLPSLRLVARGGESIDTGAALAAKLLEVANPPTAFVCVSDTMALGVLRTVQDRGLTAGRDVAVVGFDDSPTAALVRPGLSSVRQPIDEVAARLLAIVLQDLTAPRPDPARPQWAPTAVLVAPTLVVRGSSGPVPEG